MQYPFIPKSTKHLSAGQFWPIRLSSGFYACGLVLQTAQECGQRDTRSFLAALIDWSSAQPPCTDTLQRVELLKVGKAHIKTITEHNSQISGCIDLKEVGLEVPLFLSQSGGDNCVVQRGFEILGQATDKQISNLPVFVTMGYSVLNNLAENQFVC